MGVTRFYLQSTGAPPISPPFDSFWTATGNAVRRNMSPVKQNTPLSTLNIPVTAASEILFYQFISAPFTAAVVTNQCFFGARLIGNQGVNSALGLTRIEGVFKVTDATGVTVKARYSITTDSLTEGPPFASPPIYSQLPTIGFPQSIGTYNPPSIINGSDMYTQFYSRLSYTDGGTLKADAVSIAVGDRMIFEFGAGAGQFPGSIGLMAGDSGTVDVNPAWGATVPVPVGLDITTVNPWVDFVDQSGPNAAFPFF